MARAFVRLFVSLARTAAVSILAPLLLLPMSIETLQPWACCPSPAQLRKRVQCSRVRAMRVVCTRTFERKASACVSALSFLFMMTLQIGVNRWVTQILNAAKGWCLTPNLKMKYDTRGDASEAEDSTAAPSL
jgi:hypothetical protein